MSDSENGHSCAKLHGGTAAGSGDFAIGEDGRARVQGALSFGTAATLLPIGARAIEAGRVSSVDLSKVSAGDSAGLALLIEWLSVARAAGRVLRYEKVPSQLKQLARLSEVDALLDGTAPAEVPSHAATEPPT